MLHIIAPVNLTPSQKSIIYRDIFGKEFSWYRQRESTLNIDINPRLQGTAINTPFFAHTLMKRHENSGVGGGFISSSLYKMFHEIFDTWMKEQDIPYTYVFRACINLTYNQDADYSVPHVDHEWPHSNWIMYLNTVDDAGTVLFNDDYSVDCEIPCKMFTAASFPEQLHAQKFPKGTDQRLVVVFTYR
jgi:hypothetical protein